MKPPNYILQMALGAEKWPYAFTAKPELAASTALVPDSS
jgi:hypothetical protein